jgi:hypothetical protein
MSAFLTTKLNKEIIKVLNKYGKLIKNDKKKNNKYISLLVFIN